MSILAMYGVVAAFSLGGPHHHLVSCDNVDFTFQSHTFEARSGQSLTVPLTLDQFDDKGGDFELEAIVIQFGFIDWTVAGEIVADPKAAVDFELAYDGDLTICVPGWGSLTRSPSDITGQTVLAGTTIATGPTGFSADAGPVAISEGEFQDDLSPWIGTGTVQGTLTVDLDQLSVQALSQSPDGDDVILTVLEKHREQRVSVTIVYRYCDVS